jgi:chromosome segregation ATPase
MFFIERAKKDLKNFSDNYLSRKWFVGEQIRNIYDELTLSVQNADESNSDSELGKEYLGAIQRLDELDPKNLLRKLLTNTLIDIATNSVQTKDFQLGEIPKDTLDNINDLEGQVANLNIQSDQFKAKEINLIEANKKLEEELRKLSAEKNELTISCKNLQFENSELKKYNKKQVDDLEQNILYQKSELEKAKSDVKESIQKKEMELSNTLKDQKLKLEEELKNKGDQFKDFYDTRLKDKEQEYTKTLELAKELIISQHEKKMSQIEAKKDSLERELEFTKKTYQERLQESKEVWTSNLEISTSHNAQLIEQNKMLVDALHGGFKFIENISNNMNRLTQPYTSQFNNQAYDQHGFFPSQTGVDQNENNSKQNSTPQNTQSPNG